MPYLQIYLLGKIYSWSQNQHEVGTFLVIHGIKSSEKFKSPSAQSEACLVAFMLL